MLFVFAWIVHGAIVHGAVVHGAVVHNRNREMLRLESAINKQSIVTGAARAEEHL